MGAVGILGGSPAPDGRLNVMLHVSGAAGGEFRRCRPIEGMTPDDAATILLVEDDVATRTFLADNLSADGYELLVADCVSDGLRLLERKFPDLAADRPRAARRQRLRAAAPRALRRRRVEPARPADAAHGAERPLVGARPRPRLRPRRRRLRLQAVLLSRSCAAASPRCCGAANRQPTRGCVRAGELEVDPAVARGAAARRAASRCRRRSSRCCARSSPTRRGSSPRRSSCARSGAIAPPARRARWTRTRAGCARSSACTATASSSTCGASATGSSTGRSSAARAASGSRPDPSHANFSALRGANFARCALYGWGLYRAHLSGGRGS